MEKLTEVFKALGDPTRLKIVKMLAQNGEMCVCTFVDELGMGQSAVSHHMAALRHAGLVLSRKKGQWVHYSLNAEAIKEEPLAFLEELLTSFSTLRIGETDQGCCSSK